MNFTTKGMESLEDSIENLEELVFYFHMNKVNKLINSKRKESIIEKCTGDKEVKIDLLPNYVGKPTIILYDKKIDLTYSKRNFKELFSSIPSSQQVISSLYSSQYELEIPVRYELIDPNLINQEIAQVNISVPIRRKN